MALWTHSVGCLRCHPDGSNGRGVVAQRPRPTGDRGRVGLPKGGSAGIVDHLPTVGGQFPVDRFDGGGRAALSVKWMMSPALKERVPLRSIAPFLPTSLLDATAAAPPRLARPPAGLADTAPQVESAGGHARSEEIQSCSQPQARHPPSEGGM
jgi:hypothetical protein